jgi:hypothetical protein
LGGGSARRKAAAYTQSNTTQNRLTQTSIPRMGFEHTTPMFERAKTVHALDRAATVIGTSMPLADSSSRSQSLNTVLSLALEASTVSLSLMLRSVKCFSFVGGGSLRPPSRYITYTYCPICGGSGHTRQSLALCYIKR